MRNSFQIFAILFFLFSFSILASEKCNSALAKTAALLKDLPTLNRTAAIEAMTHQHNDILIIGGGATGLSAANTAASRGLKVALIEQGDLASGTSGFSTKINHGGVRYLKDALFDFLKLKIKSGKQKYNLVKEGLHERNLSLQNAPHNVKPLPIFTPVFTYFDLVQMWIGLKMYEKLAGPSPFPKSRYVSKKEAMKLFPNLKSENLKGGVMYSDGQFNDTQMAVDLAQTAARQGAHIANYVGASDFIKESSGKITGVMIQDKLTGQTHLVKAKVIINATGAFADNIRKMDDPTLPALLGPSSGVHIILPKEYLPEDHGVLIPETTDGRVLFVLPWKDHVLAGTTDHKEKPIENAQATQNEIDEIIHELAKIYDKPPTSRDVTSTWKGFRPLIASTGDTKSAVRDFLIDKSQSGLITIVGGKWTNARYMGDKVIEQAVDLGELTPTRDSQTQNLKITGAENYHDDIIPMLISKYHFPANTAKHLAQTYGDRAETVAQIAELGYSKRLHPDLPNIEAEVVFATMVQAAIHPIDVLSRRTRISFLNKDAAIQALPRVVEIMSEIKQWDATQIQSELENALHFLNKK